MTVAALPERAMSTRVSTRTSDVLYRNRWLLAILLLGSPLLWIGVVYVGSLLAFLLNSVYGLDEFSGLIDYRFTLSTFALTLGDYIIPQVVGTSRFFIGQAVYTQQGTAGNIPLAAAFTVVPIVIMGIYLWIAKRMGAFDAL
jgi:ABC-type spermidine/putrescine transport system permease subunit I